MNPVPPESLAHKVEFLRRADSYPDVPKKVEVIETHFAWVFLTTSYAYKLKKPIKFHSIDYRSLASRHSGCISELTLNRRLSESVYLDVVPLCHDGSSYRLEGSGHVVEWLVKMRRLRADRMLDRAAVSGQVSDTELDALANKLAKYYGHATRAPWSADEYTRILFAQSEQLQAQMAPLGKHVDLDEVSRLVGAQHDFVDRNGAALRGRVFDEHIVDAHGDLRPEHVFLADEPQIIDCVEFSQELRWLDAAEEISLLDLECAQLGSAGIGSRISTSYKREAHDPIGEDLYQFYRSRRALARAVASAWHIDEYLAGHTPQYWSRRSSEYLRIAERSIDNALAAAE